MKKLRIAYLSVFHPFRGGIAQFNNELYKALEAHCEVKAFNFKRQYPSLLFPGKTQYVEDNDPNPGIESEAVLDSVNPFTARKTRKLINDFNPDVVITSYWMPFFAPILGMVLKGVKGKKVALLHNVIPHEKRKLDDAFNRFYLKNNDAFVVLSDTVQKQLLQYQPKADFIQIPHPLYRHFGRKLEMADARAKLSIDMDRKVVLFFGFVRKYKGLDLLIDAMAVLDDSYTLLIAGESYEDFSVIEKQLNDKGVVGEKLSKHVKYIADEDVKLYFSASDVCALPYRTATQSGIASVAKHFEIPMVVTPVGELPNEVVHLENGFVCESVSAAAIALGIEKTFENRALFAEHQKKENERNTFENFSKKLIDFL